MHVTQLNAKSNLYRNFITSLKNGACIYFGPQIMKLSQTQVKICSQAKTLDIINTKNFNVCLLLSSHHFIYMKFQFSFMANKECIDKSKISYDPGAWSFTERGGVCQSPPLTSIIITLKNETHIGVYYTGKKHI